MFQTGRSISVIEVKGHLDSSYFAKKRRFKRDNTLYVKSGRTTRTATHGLTHFFVREVAKRNFVDGENDFGIGRQIMRVYILF